MSASFFVRIGAKLDEFDRHLTQAENRMRQMGGRMQDVGERLTKAFTVPLAGAAAVSLRFQSDFEKTMTQLVTLSGVSADQMQKMRKAILDMAPAVGRGPGELSKALLVVTSTGIRGSEALDILEASAKAAAVGLGETNVVARAVTAAVTSYGAENLSAAKAVDVLFRAVKAGGAEANELAPVLGRVTGVAAQLGVTFEEVGTFIATFTRLGVNADEAVTSLGATLATLLKPSAEAEKVLGAMGLSMADLRQQVREKGLTQALIDLVNAFDGNEEALATIIPNVRALRGVLGTAGAQADQFKQVLREVSDETDTVDRAFQRTKGTSSQTFSELKSRGEAVATTFGEALAPSANKALEAMGWLAEHAQKLSDAFAEAPAPVQQTVVGVGAFLAAIGPGVWVLGSFLRNASAIAPALKTLGGAAGVAAFGVKGLVVALVALGATGVQKVGTWIGEQIIDLGKWVYQLDAVQKGINHVIAALTPGLSVAHVQAAREAAAHRREMDELRRSWDEVKGSFGITSGKNTGKWIELPTEGKPGAGGTGGTGGGGGAPTGVTKLTEAMQELRDKMQDAKIQAQAWAAFLTELGGVTSLTAKQKEELHGVLQNVIDQYGSLRAAGLGALEPLLTETQKLLEGSRVLGSTLADVRAFMGLPGTPANRRNLSLIDMLSWQGQNTTSGIGSVAGIGTNQGAPGGPPSFWRQMFGGMGDAAKAMPAVVLQSLMGGGSVTKSVGAMFGGTLLNEKVGSTIGGFVTKALGGGAIGKALGGALGSIVPGLGTIVGSFIGSGLGKLFGGLFGPSKREKEAKETSQMREQFLEQVGGLEELRRKADEAGFSIGRLLATNRPQEFRAEVEKLNRALEQHKVKVEGLNTAVAGVQMRAEAFALEMRRALELTDPKAQKRALKELEGDFDRLGQFALATFQGVAQQSGSIAQAFEAASPAVNALIAAQKEHGFAASASTEAMLDLFRAVEENKGVFMAIDGATMMLKGFGDAGLLTAELFQTIGADIGAQFEKLTKRGMDANQAMVLMQPSLQALWEAQQKFGLITDETTAKLLKQAEEAGVVGAHQKGVMDKILDVLLAIGDALGAKLPEAFQSFRQAGHEAAQQVRDEFGRLRINIPVQFKTQTAGFRVGEETIRVRPFAEGGIVRRPTLGLVGEKGPEAVTPLDQFMQMQRRPGESNELVSELRDVRDLLEQQQVWMADAIRKGIRDAMLTSR